MSKNINVLMSLVDKFSAPMRKIGENTKNTSVEMKRATNAVNKFGKSAGNALLNAGKIAGTAFAGALAGVASYSVKVGADFDASMSKVSAISGATGEELLQLREKAKQMGATTEFSASQSAQAFQFMAMAGWKTSEMLNGIDGIMNLASASGEELASVSDIVTDALTAFGLQAKDAGHFADVLATASSNSNTNVALMGSTFQYVAPLAGALKYNIEDVAQAIGLMANAGIKGEKAGTALRSVFTRLAKPPKEARKAMDALGISITNQDGTVKPFMQTMEELRDKFAGLSDAQKAQYSANIAGQEAMSGLLAIINASEDDFKKLAKAIDNSDGSAKKMADTMNNNLRGKFKAFKSVVEGIGINIYEKFDKPLTSALNNVNGSLTNLNQSITSGDLKGKFDKLGESIGVMVSAIADGLIVALPVVIDMFSWLVDNGDVVIATLAGISAGFMAFKIANIFFTLQKALQGVTVATALFNMVLAMNPAVLIATGVMVLVGAVVLLWKNWDKVVNSVKNAWDWLGRVKDVKIFGNAKTEEPQHNATGTSYFKGGQTYVNEGNRGELINLPSGSQIVPHDKVQPQSQPITINLTVQGNVIGNEDFINQCGQMITSRLKTALANV